MQKHLFLTDKNARTVLMYKRIIANSGDDEIPETELRENKERKEAEKQGHNSLPFENPLTAKRISHAGMTEKH